jgi:hypothetical protein
MSFFEHDDCFIWRCDKCLNEAVFAPGNFWSCVAELKARRWGFIRGEGDWDHRCPECRKASEENVSEMVLVPKKRSGVSE